MTESSAGYIDGSCRVELRKVLLNTALDDRDDVSHSVVHEAPVKRVLLKQDGVANPEHN